MRESALRNFLVHLRLPFQALLAPFMLLGAALSHGEIQAWRFALAFVVLHVCIYGGTTAYNSHYDRDEGPIGGLEHPPPPGPWLLPGGILISIVGLALALIVGVPFFLVCFAFAILGVLYSRPVPRLKAKPFASVLTVMAGQGVLGALAGVSAVSDARFSAELVLGVVAAAVLVGGLYPISQIFQLEEDRARGDRTIAIALGRRGVTIASAALFTVGAWCLAASAWIATRHADALLFAFVPVPMTIGAKWACADVKNSFRRVMTLQTCAALLFGSYTIWRLVRA